jgi:hypothetical protein
VGCAQLAQRDDAVEVLGKRIEQLASALALAIERLSYACVASRDHCRGLPENNSRRRLRSS